MHSMKQILMFTALTLAAQLSQAKVVCNVSKGNPQKDMVFDQLLFSAEVNPPRYVLIKKGSDSADEVQLSQFDTYEKWQAIDGAMLISLSQTQEPKGVYGITVGHIDITKGNTNMLPLDAMALGEDRKNKGPFCRHSPHKSLSHEHHPSRET